jgi:hypothetical protein
VDDDRVTPAGKGIRQAVDEFLFGFMRGMMFASENDDAVTVLKNGIRLLVRLEARRGAAGDQ